MTALVDQDLTVLCQHDGRALERTRRGALEIYAGRTEAAAVAGALELVFRRQIIRRAAEVRAGDAQRVETAGVLLDVLSGPHQPDAVLFLPSLVDADAVLVREASLELLRRLVEHVRKHEAPGRGERGGGRRGERAPRKAHPGAARQQRGGVLPVPGRRPGRRERGGGACPRATP